MEDRYEEEEDVVVGPAHVERVVKPIEEVVKKSDGPRSGCLEERRKRDPRFR